MDTIATFLYHQPDNLLIPVWVFYPDKKEAKSGNNKGSEGYWAGNPYP